MENLGYYNGTVDLIENIRIPMTDRVWALFWKKW